MPNAALTFVYNESVNLPIWVRYYGNLFGHENLFVIDRSSDDGSTDDLGRVNVIRVPRTEFDEKAKTALMSSFHAGLTAIYDAVVVTDCDEILLPDPARYSDLGQYIEKMDGDYVNAIGIDIVHIITEEAPIDLGRPILSQRSYGRFQVAECKHLLSRIPIRWLPGLHCSNMKPRFDADLLLLHLKLIDYGIAVKRQMINLATTWSAASLERNFGAHHRFPIGQFVKQYFLAPMDLVNRNQIGAFDFTAEIAELEAGTVTDPMGNYRIPKGLTKIVQFPERFREVF